MHKAHKGPGRPRQPPPSGELTFAFPTIVIIIIGIVIVNNGIVIVIIGIIFIITLVSSPFPTIVIAIIGIVIAIIGIVICCHWNRHHGIIIIII